MKAFLLAAGLGTRLRPITDTLPKCLVPVNGRPLLSYWMDLLERNGVEEVLINLHHLPDPVRAFAADYEGPIRIELVMEEELLGSAGTLYVNRDFVAGEEQFYILYADNLTNVDISRLRDFNSAHPATLTVGLLHMDKPETRGIVTLDDEGRIVAFEEKPLRPKGDLASAGMFIARQDLFQYVIPDSIPFDLGSHAMPRMVGPGMMGRMNGMLVQGYLRDIGTHESLTRAEKEWMAL